MSESDQKTSRRHFLAGSGVAVASGLMPAINAEAKPAVSANAFNGLALQDQIWNFEKEPKHVSDAEISKTLDCDILIVGSGASGMPATVAAVEAGQKVITIEKLSKEACMPKADRPDLGRAIGAWFGFPDHRLLARDGIKTDPQAEAASYIRGSLWRCNQQVLQEVIRNSRKVSDWWLDKLAEQGINVDALPLENNGERQEAAEFKNARPRPGCNIYWHHGMIICPAGIQEHALESWLGDNDFEITYGTAAKYLLRNKEGRVTGLVAQDVASGKYIKINASKGVILATGGYEGNKEMMKKYIPESNAYGEVFGKKTNTGDGYLMAQWIGCRMDPWPHCPQSWDGMSPEALKLGFDYIGVARQAIWMYLNAYGERFMNEDATFAGVGRSMYMQPHSMMWTVFDDHWRDRETVWKGKGTVCRRMTDKFVKFVLPMNTTKATEIMIKEGVILKADSIEELAEKMKKAGPGLGIGDEISVETLRNQLNRYNELCRKGEDEDFGKDPQCLIPLDKPPYYACRTTVGILVTQAGPLVNKHWQATDKKGHVVPGLYAIGNVSGGFNQYETPMDAPLNSLSYAVTSGYLAARHCAGLKS